MVTFLRFLPVNSLAFCPNGLVLKREAPERVVDSSRRIIFLSKTPSKVSPTFFPPQEQSATSRWPLLPIRECNVYKSCRNNDDMFQLIHFGIKAYSK